MGIFGWSRDKSLYAIREVKGYDIPGPGYQYQVEYEIYNRKTKEVVDKGRTRFYANPNRKEIDQALRRLKLRWEETHAQV